MGEAETLTCHTTNRDGYWEYKIDLKICADCSTRHLCTHSKDCAKAVQRPGPGIQRVKLKFAAMNLKKLAKILEKRGWNTVRFLLILKKIKRKEVFLSDRLSTSTINCFHLANFNLQLIQPIESTYITILYLVF